MVEKTIGIGDSVNSSNEVIIQTGRRRFSNKYKLRILEKADNCTKPGEIGMLLRQEGIYSSTLSNWRSWRNKMQKNKKKNGSSAEDLRNENARLKRKVERLELKLARSEGLIELQKKVSAILELENLAEKRSGRDS